MSGLLSGQAWFGWTWCQPALPDGEDTQPWKNRGLETARYNKGFNVVA